MIASVSTAARVRRGGFLALAPQDMSEVGGGLEMPAAAALDQLDAAAGIMAGKLGKRRGDVALADMERDVGGVSGSSAREQGRLDRAQGVVELPHAALT